MPRTIHAKVPEEEAELVDELSEETGMNKGEVVSMLLHRGLKDCGFVSYEFNKVRDFEPTQDKCHTNVEGLNVEGRKNDSEVVFCEVCGEEFKTKQALGSHKHYKHGSEDKKEGSEDSKEGSREKLEVKGSRDKKEGSEDSKEGMEIDTTVYSCADCGFEGLVKGEKFCQECGAVLDWGAINEK